MRIAVSLSGTLRVVTGSAGVELSLEGADKGEKPTLADALGALCTRYPQTRRYLLDTSNVTAIAPGVRVLLNGARPDDATSPKELVLHDGDRLALLMPVMGG